MNQTEHTLQTKWIPVLRKNKTKNKQKICIFLVLKKGPDGRGGMNEHWLAERDCVMNNT